jgi:hypothetical protein
LPIAEVGEGAGGRQHQADLDRRILRMRLAADGENGGDGQADGCESDLHEVS